MYTASNSVSRLDRKLTKSFCPECILRIMTANEDKIDSIELRIAEVVSNWLKTLANERTTEQKLISEYPNLALGLEEALLGARFAKRGSPAIVNDISSNDEAAQAYIPSGFREIPGFQFLRVLGCDGLGVFFEAGLLSLDRLVALKVLPWGNVDARAAERFAREAEAIARLEKPNIVPIHAVGVHHGCVGSLCG